MNNSYEKKEPQTIAEFYQIIKKEMETQKREIDAQRNEMKQDMDLIKSLLTQVLKEVRDIKEEKNNEKKESF